MNATTQEHWQSVYQNKSATQTSWHCVHLDESLRYIDALDLARDAQIIDLGAGRSNLLDDLHHRGFTELHALDVSAAALDEIATRLQSIGATPSFTVADVREASFAPETFDLWHDRAVFHFLTDPMDQARYRQMVSNAIKTNGHLLLATFAEEGPERCSGLPVTRYSADALQSFFQPCFELKSHSRDLHHTPFGTTQMFTYVLLQRTDSSKFQNDGDA